MGKKDRKASKKQAAAASSGASAKASSNKSKAKIFPKVSDVDIDRKISPVYEFLECKNWKAAVKTLNNIVSGSFGAAVPRCFIVSLVSFSFSFLFCFFLLHSPCR